MLRLLSSPTADDVGQLIGEMDAVQVVLDEVLRYQQELDLEGSSSSA